jgi:hypothetical protein
MICPNCNRAVGYKRRRGNGCAFCRAEFALEPRRNQLRLHDLRVRRLDKKLSDGGRWRYTTRQLWYAASRKLPTEGPRRLVLRWFTGPFFGSLFLVAFFHIISGWRYSDRWFAIWLAIVVPLYLLLIVFHRLRRRRAERIMPIPLEVFRDLVIHRWAKVYRRPPPNLVDERGFTPPRVDRPRVAVVCPDVSVLVCLAANGVSDKFAAVLSTGAVPPNVPVVLLHDASQDGIRFAASTRAALSGRIVVDAGLHVWQVMAKPGMLLRRERFRAKNRGLPVTAAEHAWLQRGLWSPIGATKPARLVAVLARAILQIEVLADPESRQAARTGYLSWPAS